MYSQIVILFFSEFSDLKKYFLSTFLWIRLKHKHTFWIPKHLLNVGWMFLQHWATCWCRRPSVEQAISAAGESPHVLTIRHQLAAIALISPSKTWEYVVWSAVYCWLVLFTWQYTTWRYNYFTLLNFGALKLFFDFFLFLVRISRLYSFI